MLNFTVNEGRTKGAEQKLLTEGSSALPGCGYHHRDTELVVQ